MPSSFLFEGRIVFAVNTLPARNHAFQAVLSRVDQFELSASNEEVLEMMRRLAAWKECYEQVMAMPDEDRECSSTCCTSTG